jgi:hypothetical protein
MKGYAGSRDNQAGFDAFGTTIFAWQHGNALQHVGNPPPKCKCRLATRVKTAKSPVSPTGLLHLAATLAAQAAA